LAAVAIVALSALMASWRSASPLLASALGALAVASVTLIAPLLYTLGYGFDGFLHRASELLLATTGTLEPKPPYYIGQYVFVTWLARLLSLPLKAIDPWLVPLAAALLPAAFALTAQTRRTAGITAAGIVFLLPLGAFIATTPQSFAYALGLIAVAFAVSARRGQRSSAPAFALAAWSVATHPLAGLPFLFATLAVLWITRPFLAWPSVILGALSVPLAFAVNGARGSAQVQWDLGRVFDVSWFATLRSAIMPPATHAALWADWAAFVSFALPLFLVALAVLAIACDRNGRPMWIALAALALGMTLAAHVLKTAGDFAFLIDYERGNYADRLLLLAQLLLLFPAGAAIPFLRDRLTRQPPLLQGALFLFLAAWFGAQAYVALPRHDAVVIGRGWSVGKADDDAVRFIENDAGDRPYTVLANQSVSAAAVNRYGFKRYAGDVFYYPIPTGGPLYEMFLRAVGSDPSRETIREAARLGQSELVYVVLNAYWWNAEQVAEQLAAIADDEREFGGGAVRVYRFDTRRDKKR
jgi:hypothetical protein